MNLSQLTEFCQKCDIFDKNFKISDIDLALKASKYSLNQINTAYGLIRHEFLEFVLRTALDKYHRSGICSSEPEAIKYFFENHVLKYITTHDQDRWRVDRYFTKYCEEVVLDYKEFLQTLFELNSGKKAKPGEKKYMRLEDFIGVCQTYELLNENFNIRNVTLCYHMALNTHVDEMSTLKHMEASKMEFIEALARVIDFNGSLDAEKDMLGYVYPAWDLDEKLKSFFSAHGKVQSPKKISKRNTFAYDKS